jgi:hypothetical protein
MYKLDTNAARAAESGGGRISECGAYKGKFIRAQAIEATTGTKGIDIDFISDAKQRARFTIYTERADGTRIFGFNQLMSIMTCMSLRELSDPKMITARIYDFDAGREVDQDVMQFSELLNKPIGMLFEMEEYKLDKWKPVMAGAFQADTELMASEILDRKTAPEALAKRIHALRDRPMKTQGSTALRPAPEPSRSGGIVGMDDDIPW